MTPREELLTLLETWKDRGVPSTKAVAAVVGVGLQLAAAIGVSPADLVEAYRCATVSVDRVRATTTP